MRSLNLGNNEFSGDIPSSWGNASKLEELNLSKNELEGIVDHIFHFSFHSILFYFIWFFFLFPVHQSLMFLPLLPLHCQEHGAFLFWLVVVIVVFVDLMV